MGPRKTFRVPLRVVFYREDESWIAHCLEFDLCGDGTSKIDALEMLTDAIVLQTQVLIEHDSLSNLFCPADGKYFRMYAEGTDSDIAKGVMQVSVKRLQSEAPMIVGVEAREYDECDSELVPVC